MSAMSDLISIDLDEEIEAAADEVLMREREVHGYRKNIARYTNMHAAMADERITTEDRQILAITDNNRRIAAMANLSEKDAQRVDAARQKVLLRQRCYAEREQCSIAESALAEARRELAALLMRRDATAGDDELTAAVMAAKQRIRDGRAGV